MSDNSGSIVKSCMMNFQKWLGSYRVLVIFLMEFLYFCVATEDVRQFLVQENENIGISCYYFVLWCSSVYGRLIMMIGLILLFCNAPFTDEQQLFVMIRLGKWKWFLGQIMYIVLGSVVYFLIMVLFNIIRFLPYVGFSLEWGDILYAWNLHGPLKKAMEILDHYQPVEAMTLCFTICVLTGIFFGLFLLFINMKKSGMLGIAVLVCWSACSLLLDGMPEKIKIMVVHLCPSEWSWLDYYVNRYYNISYGYTYGFLIVGILALFIGIFLRVKKCDIAIVENI